MSRLISLLAGLLFGLGMMVSGMVDPAKVVGFLDFAGAWDPSLMFVMGGALLVFIPVYFLYIRHRSAPLCGTDFHVSQKSKIDPKLLIGSVLFGVGWGLVGICPGPALTALASSHSSLFIFVAAMVAGIWGGCLVGRIFERAQV